MDKFRVHGGVALEGQVRVSGAKNSVLPILAAGLLSGGPLVVKNVPRLVDVLTMTNLLRTLGANVRIGVENEQQEPCFDESISPEKLFQRATSYGVNRPLCVSIDASQVRQADSNLTAPYELVKTMRASILVLGPLLARFGEARVSLPGGCAIGSRPVDFHIKALTQMGADINMTNGYIHAFAPNGLSGAKICFDTVTVTGTENIIMAAVLAKGETIIENAAREPEIIDLINCLQSMGADIEGGGTTVIRIQGQKSLKPAQHSVIADRIEAGTFLCAAAATRGSITLEGIDAQTLDAVLLKLEQAGADIQVQPNRIQLNMHGRRPQAVDIVTAPYPGFPTDLQAQLMALNTLAHGSSIVVEKIFENRFMHVTELCRLGADIKINGTSAHINGVESLNAAPVMATDLRASASLLIGALAANGATEIGRIYHMDRGYEQIESKLGMLGGRIERVQA